MLIILYCTTKKQLKGETFRYLALVIFSLEIYFVLMYLRFDFTGCFLQLTFSVVVKLKTSCLRSNLSSFA